MSEELEADSIPSRIRLPFLFCWQNSPRPLWRHVAGTLDFIQRLLAHLWLVKRMLSLQICLQLLPLPHLVTFEGYVSVYIQLGTVEHRETTTWIFWDAHQGMYVRGLYTFHFTQEICMEVVYYVQVWLAALSW